MLTIGGHHPGTPNRRPQTRFGDNPALGTEQMFDNGAPHLEEGLDI
jgi:hypothetical protein